MIFQIKRNTEFSKVTFPTQNWGTCTINRLTLTNTLQKSSNLWKWLSEKIGVKKFFREIHRQWWDRDVLYWNIRQILVDPKRGLFIRISCFNVKSQNQHYLYFFILGSSWQLHMLSVSNCSKYSLLHYQIKRCFWWHFIGKNLSKRRI